MLSMGRLYSRSVTGGYVYHGEKIPWLKGKYIFGDYLRGILYIDIDHPEEMLTTPEILLYKPPTLHGPNKGRTVLFSSFGEDENGENQREESATFGTDGVSNQVRYKAIN